jgi:hypothetical protein
MSSEPFIRWWVSFRLGIEDSPCIPQVHRAPKSYFGTFNDELRGKNEKKGNKYPDNIADHQRQSPDMIGWNRYIDFPPPSNRNRKKWKAKYDSHART